MPARKKSDSPATIGAKWKDWKTYVKGKFGKVAADRFPMLALDTAYAGNDLFILPNVLYGALREAYNAWTSGSLGDSMIDFSTPESSLASIGIIIANGGSVAIGIDTVRRGYNEIRKLKSGMNYVTDFD